MGNNASVRRFKTDMLDLDNQMRYSFHQSLLMQADELVGNIKNAIQHSETGHLKESVRKKDVSRITADDARYTVLVLAGGPLTTKRTKSGHSFDYALAEEFGTIKEDPRPFFYNMARLYRAQGLERFRETLKQTIASNNELRARRGDNYSSGPGGFGGKWSYDNANVERGGTPTSTVDA